MAFKEKCIAGFSKLSKSGKLKWIAQNFFGNAEQTIQDLTSFWLRDEKQQKVLDGFSENTITNFTMPYGVAPNFMINGQVYCVPMVIEESSVVAAASSAAKYWLTRGGFHAKVLDTVKIGQVHFYWQGQPAKLQKYKDELKWFLTNKVENTVTNMKRRGGGILDMELLSFADQEPGLFQLKVHFETCESMGANFINTVLEEFSSQLEVYFDQNDDFVGEEKEVNVIMSILSNYTPDCMVRAWVECPIPDLSACKTGMSAEEFADRFHKAIRIAQIDPHRATTHNKGIFNGVDAVVLATGNDFRAVEACGHTYAARDGQYRSLSGCSIENGMFRFWLDLPLAVGVVGGLTKLHPMANKSLEMLGNPTARELMMIIAATGLAQNFGAVRSLVTTGIQHGHMKMHLQNILNHLEATDKEKERATRYFSESAEVVSFRSVRDFLQNAKTEVNKPYPSDNMFSS